MTKQLKLQIAAKLRAARMARALTQEQLAEAIGRTPEAVSNIERASALPTIETLQMLSATLNVPLAEFFEPARSARKINRDRLEMEYGFRALIEKLPDADLRLAFEQSQLILRIRR
jgi:transcriptional regulator with XRE-family HTH domain